MDITPHPSILLVDDTPANLQLLIEALGERDYQVRPAINGELALESARLHCPDLVLLDINLPGIDGYEVCRCLKADPATAEVPVIFISSMEGTIDKVKAFEAGGVDYVSKPFQSEEVLARIHSHLELRRTQLELAEHKANLEQLVEERTIELLEKNRALREEISYRSDMEKALQESEHRYLSLVEEGFDGIFVHQDFKLVYVNQQVLDMTGYTADELLGHDGRKFLAAETLERAVKHVEQVKHGFVEINLTRKDGSILQVEGFGVDCRFQGKPARISAVRDISARKQAEEELRSSEQRYANLYHQFDTLLDAISDPLALFAADRQLVWTNAAYDQTREIMQEGAAYLHEALIDRGSPVQRCFQSVQVVEEMIVTPDQRSWRVKAFPLANSKAELSQVIAIAVDITEKLRLREEADRSSRLASLGELAAGIAHEINNPNAVVLLNAPIIRDAFEDADPILQDYAENSGSFTLAGIDYGEMKKELPVLIERIEESAIRIKRIVEDLKNFVRDEGPQEFSLLDPNKVIETAVRLMDNSIKKASSNFQLDLAKELPRVKGDFQKLEQVVVNLIQNACQALTSRDQAVCVKTGYAEQEGKVLICVFDQGVGIDPEQLARISDPFFTTKRSSGGTGLGLSVSQRILQEHGAQLQVKSSPGEGSEFCVLLPLADEEE